MTSLFVIGKRAVLASLADNKPTDQSIFESILPPYLCRVKGNK